MKFFDRPVTRHTEDPGAAFRRMRIGLGSVVKWSAGVVLALPALAWAQSTDLVANNAGPSTSAAGSPFTYVVRLSNNGPWDADGATFTTTMPTGAVDVSATCTAATGGASCPDDLAFTNALVSGTLPALPDQGQVEITVTGVYGIGSPTSVTSTATITPPDGVIETHPVTNTSTQNTTLITDARLIVGKTQATAGDTVTYTITLVNEGNAAAHGAMFRDYLNSTGTTSAPSRATINASFVSCQAEGGAQCPEDSAFGSFSGVKGTTNRNLFNTAVPLLPAGGRLTVVYTADIEPDTTTCGSSTAALRNYATITPPSGITNTLGTPSVFASLSVPGTAACPVNQPFGELIKTQTLADGTPLANGADLPYGTPIRYTITATNTTAEDASGAMIRDYTNSAGTNSSGQRSRVDARFISCAAAGGAVCPDDGQFPDISRGGGTTGNNGNLFNTAIPTFPAGSAITIVYEAEFAPNTAYCGNTSGLFRNYAQLTPPAGSEYVVRTTAAVQVRLPANDVCPDVQVSKAQSTTTPQPGVAFEYEVTVTNHGPGDADGAVWSDYMYTSSSSFVVDLRFDIEYLSCTPTPGAECPAADRFNDWDSIGLASSRYLVASNTAIPRLPEGGSITLLYRVTPGELAAGSCRNATGNISNTTSVRPAEALTSRVATVHMPVTCADVGISKAVDPIFVTPGDEVTYTVKVSNAGLGNAANVLFSDPLPGYFEFTSAECAVTEPSVAGAETACGASVDYDPDTHTLSSVIANVGMLGEVEFTIRGIAGVEPGTHKNEAEVILPPSLFDPIMATNLADINVQLQNTSSAITVVKQVAGQDDSMGSGLPVDMSFTGTVTCGAQPPQNWSITIPAGGSNGSSAPMSFYDTEVCTVTEDTSALPVLPDGYAWVGEPVIDNTTDPLGTSTPREVTVTNTIRGFPAVAARKALTAESGAHAGYAEAGETLTYTVTLGNTGTASAIEHTFYEILPAHTSLLEVVGGASSCPVGTSGAEPCTITVVAPIPAGGEVEVLVRVQVVDPLPAGLEQIVNLITDNTGAPPPSACDPANPGHCVTTPVVPASVSVAKSSNPATGVAVQLGDELTYTVTVAISDAPNVGVITLTDTLGEGLELVAASFDTPVGGSCDAVAQVITCELAAGTAVGEHVFSYRALVLDGAADAVRNTVVPSGDDNPSCVQCDTEHPLPPAGGGDVTPVPVNAPWAWMAALLAIALLSRRLQSAK